MPIIFEPHPPLSKSVNEVWVISAGGPNWGGANVHVSLDGDSYKLVGTLYAGARVGFLTAPLPTFAGTNPDPISTLQVDLAISRGQLVSASEMAASNGVTLCYCDGELLAYQTATLLGGYQYNLQRLWRGLFSTASTEHESGSVFSFIGIEEEPLGCFKYDYPASLIGAEIQIKLQSFNSFLMMAEDLSEVEPFTYILTGTGSIQPLNIPFQFIGIPQNGVPILNYTFGAIDNFPVNLAGSVCTAGVAATALTIFDVAKSGTNFATMTFAASATTATFAGTGQMFGPGDILKITPRRTDATLANLTGNLAGIS